MQMFAVIVKVLFVALAASAAKLPLPPSAGIAPGINIPVPSQPSTLYGVPFESLPISSVPAVAIQTPAEIPSTPAQLSTLYEAPVEDIPSFAQPSLQVQNAELPSLFGLPTEGFPAPAQQASVIQSQSSLGPIQQNTVNLVPVPDVPSDLYELPIQIITTSVQQPSVIQTPGQIFPVPAGPVTLHQVPSANVPVHSQQPLLVAPGPADPTVLTVQVENVPSLSQQVNIRQNLPQAVQEPVEPSVLHEEPIDVISLTVQQPAVVQTPVQLVQVPAEPSTLYDVPTGLYETPEADFLVQSVPALSSQSSTGVLLTSDEPAVLHETSRLPVTVTQVHEPAALYQAPVQPIMFPQVAPAEFVPVPAVPSSLYEIPDATLDNEISPLRLDNVSAAASEPVATVVTKEEESANADDSDGQTPTGEYRVTLPDGRIQIVNYSGNGKSLIVHNISYV